MGYTVAIIDFAHSGTTMLAGICEILGVPMVGDNYKAHKWEDLDILPALKDERRFAKLVALRNAQHRSWGFKQPGAWKFSESLAYLRDPVYLAIYKDPVSVTARRFGAVSLTKMRDTLDHMTTSIQGMYEVGLAVHILSYHKAMVKPRAFVLDVAGIIGIQPEAQAVETAVQFIQPNKGGPRQRYPKVETWI